MKQILYTFLFLSLAPLTNAQNLTWAKKIGAIRPNDVAYGICSDKDANVITTGTFRDTADLDPSPSIQFFYSQGQEDVFVTKLDSNGQLLWTHQMGGVQGDFGYAIACDQHKNIYVAGSFSNRCDFNIGSTQTMIMSNGSYDAFVLKLSANGQLLWAKTFGGTSSEEAFAIAVKANGNVVVGGYFMSSTDFDPGTGNFTLTPQGIEDAFVDELDSNGNFVQAFAISGSLKDCIYGICSDASDNTYVSGYFEASADFDPSNASTVLTSAGASFDKDFFVAKYSPTGSLVWARNGGGLMADIAFGICLDSKKNVLTTGWFESQADFDPSSATHIVNAYSGLNDRDAFVLKLDSNGLFKWVAPLGGTDIQTGYGIACDQNDNVFTAGFNKDSLDCDPSNALQMITSKGDFDIYVHSLDANGNYRWGFDLGGITDDGANALCTDIHGQVLVAGGTSDTADFDPALQDTFNLYTQYLYDAFIAKFGSCHQPYWHAIQYKDTICKGSPAIVQLQGTAGSGVNWVLSGPMPLSSQGWYSSSNLASFPIQHSGDYLIRPASTCFGQFADTLHFTIDTINTNFSLIGNWHSTGMTYLVAQDTSLSYYQWATCDINGMQAIPNANSYFYLPSDNGDYALITQNTHCIDTSDCVVYSCQGINSSTFTNNISYYNTSNSLEIHASQPNFDLKIVNALGQEIAQYQVTDTSLSIDISDWPAGMYVVISSKNEQVATKKIIKTN